MPTQFKEMVEVKILVVEDEWLIGEELRAQFEQLGHEVLGPAVSCSEALEIIRQTRPDLAVVDTLLGSETSEAVLAELSVKAVPVVICSGHGRSQMPSFARSFPLLPKPFSDQMIAEALSASARAMTQVG